MKKNCAFTICATNYVGLAQVLEKSILEHYKDLDFYIIVADEPTLETRGRFTTNTLVAKDVLRFNYSEQKWYEMAFKYDLTEFCTSIKPASILYLFKEGYEKCIYLDPDIYVFSSIKSIFDNLDKYNAVVTPHITETEVDFTGNVGEEWLLFSGAFNLGFFAIKNNFKSKDFLSWWAHKLEDYCFVNNSESLYTDQKWIDLLPSFFGEELLINRNKGLNVAPWNYHEREIIEKNGSLFVRNRLCGDKEEVPLLFAHYSGFNYKNLLTGTIEHKHLKQSVKFADLNLIMNPYQQALLNSEILVFINEKYSYNFFNDLDSQITKIERLLYRGYVEGVNYNENPFKQESYIYCSLKKRGFLNHKVKPHTYEEMVTKHSK